MSEDTQMREEYDFSNGVRGKYYQRYMEAKAAGAIEYRLIDEEAEAEMVRLDPDLRQQFPTSHDVNTALRDYTRLLAEQRRAG